MEPLLITPLETTPLLQHVQHASVASAEIVGMKYRDVYAGTETVRRAFQKDSLMIYFVTADILPFPKLRARMGLALDWAGGIRKNRKNRVFTIDKGTAIMKYSAPGDPKNPRVIDILTRVLASFSTREMTKRQKEFAEKRREMVEDAFGAKIPEMYELQELATHPDAQGQGYGTALVKFVLERSDADNCDVWLVTTDQRGFYELLGFSVVRSTLVGADNPAWGGAPIKVYIMYRAAKGVQ